MNLREFYNQKVEDITVRIKKRISKAKDVKAVINRDKENQFLTHLEVKVGKTYYNATKHGKNVDEALRLSADAIFRQVERAQEKKRFVFFKQAAGI